MIKNENADVLKLLEELNFWVRQGGDPQHPVGSIKSTGESHSRYQDLKSKILKANCSIKWVENKYILTQSNESY